MQKAVKASWHHYASTDENQMHKYCPDKTDSWCKSQNDQMNGTSSFKPKNDAPAVMQEILPTFEALWDDNLLQSVLEGLSQNNKALNHLVWDISLKEKFAGPETVETACTLAVCLFNGGAKTLQSVLKGLHLETGQHCRSGFTTIDQEGLYAAREKALDATKAHCQIHRCQWKSQHNQQNEEQESPTYEPGAFGLWISLLRNFKGTSYVYFNEFYLVNMP